MTPATKNTLKDLGKAGIGFLIYFLGWYFIPVDSVLMQIFMYLCIATLIAGCVYFGFLKNRLDNKK